MFSVINIFDFQSATYLQGFTNCCWEYDSEYFCLNILDAFLE